MKSVSARRNDASPNKISFAGQSAIQNFVAHYHSERNHQGLMNQLISLEAGHLGNAGDRKSVV